MQRTPLSCTAVSDNFLMEAQYMFLNREMIWVVKNIIFVTYYFRDNRENIFHLDIQQYKSIRRVPFKNTVIDSRT